MPSKPDLSAGIQAFRPLLPAKDFETSLRFYEALGFTSQSLGDQLAEIRLGAHTFLLQDFYVREAAENMMMHVLVENVQAWWEVIDALDLDQHFGVRKPGAPKAEPWGLTVCYLFDPSGILWHFAEATH